MEIMLVLTGNQRFTSNIQSAAKVINSQVIIKSMNEGMNPYSAVITGNANIPAPIAVPLMSKIAPSNLLFFMICAEHFF